jgi:N-acetylmuramoyl-L-alanine amidase
VTEPGLLRRGGGGDAVRELQERLAGAGFATADRSGEFGADTEGAVRAFQGARGLHVDGICGPQTWSALVEAGYRLGDRLLYLRRPLVRGDDVVDLQQRLNALGFDAGREDGLFGPATERALRQFQRDAGVSPDGVCGPASREALVRLGSLAAGSVASVREREALRREPRRLIGRRVFVACEPGLGALGRAVEQGLSAAGASVVLDASGASDTLLAAEANRFGADLVLAVRTGDDARHRCAYFENQRFRSEGGWCVARRVDEELSALLGPADGPVGRTYSILRETTMAAVVCQPSVRGDLVGMHRLVERTAELAGAIVRGVRRGVEEPIDARS